MTASIHSDLTRSSNAPVKLRLTRRGRFVLGALVVALAVTLLATIAMFGASQAQASIENADGVAFEYVIAEPGDSLWTLANRVAPDTDARDVIFEIKRLNQLEGSDLHIGQELAIPLKYSVEG